PGGTTQTVPTNDDGYTAYDFSAVFEDGLNFFGANYSGTQVYVNTNGSISFTQGISQFTPDSITAGTTPMIAPFWADVDTRAGAPIRVNVDPTADVVTITWQNVGYFNQNTDKLNSFQLQLFDRGNGDFDIVFRYEDINWTTGDASGGSGGLGGTPAHAGFSAGNGADYFELPQSGNEGAILALDSTAGNTGTTGLWVFEVRNGVVAGDITFGSSVFVDKSNKVDKGLYGFVADFPDPSKLGVQPTKHGDLWVNTGNRQQAMNVYGHDSWDTFLHELGHALGLHHPNEDPNNHHHASNNNSLWTVMSYKPIPTEVGESKLHKAWPLTPMVLDIKAIQKLYGPNLATRATDTTYFGDGDGTTDLAYQYGANGMQVTGSDGIDRDVYLTIWDAGGTDLIDASDLSTISRIDLRPGHYSTIGSEKNNIGIAAAVKVGGTVVNYIENATAGSANDRLIGNAAVNVLHGGAGNDYAKGGKGADELHGDAGNDILRGEDQGDWLYGGDGRDLLIGGKGWDKLYGDAGRDTLVGNGGRDYFSFLTGFGHDKVKDFQDGVDAIVLDSDLWGGTTLTGDQVVAQFGSVSHGNAVLTFAGGEQVVFQGVGDVTLLADDFLFV
ncbi:MAG: hypothetical protein D6801_06670, partial [Alphaproteobacteria bacterium]